MNRPDAPAVARVLTDLSVQLRRHYYHKPYEQAPDDLIQTGVITNLEWDERDALWVALDVTITLEIPPTGSPISVYAEEGPVVTFWRGTNDWTADWDVDLANEERSQLLDRLGAVGAAAVREVGAVVDAYLAASADLDEDDRRETSDVVREWMAEDS